jgi:hypothetical protein
MGGGPSDDAITGKQKTTNKPKTRLFIRLFSPSNVDQYQGQKLAIATLLQGMDQPLRQAYCQLRIDSVVDLRSITRTSISAKRLTANSINCSSAIIVDSTPAWCRPVRGVLVQRQIEFANLLYRLVPVSR